MDPAKPMPSVSPMKNAVVRDYASVPLLESAIAMPASTWSHAPMILLVVDSKVLANPHTATASKVMLLSKYFLYNIY